MKWIFCGILLILSFVTLNDAFTDPGSPAFLSNDIERNNISGAQRKAKITHPDLKGYSGFITVNKDYNSNIFFWFIEAIKNPLSSPLGLWLQGGPGYSGFYGIFMENGPYFFKDNSTVLQKRNYSWPNFMNMIYVDNPVGTGFSFTDDANGYAHYQSDIVDNLLVFLQQFFKLFPQYCDNDFYLIGESYGAKYAIELGAALPKKYNLKGIILESGVVDPAAVDILSLALQTSLVDINGYQAMQVYQTIGSDYLQQGQYTNAFIYGTVPLLGTLFGLSGLTQQFNYLADAIPFYDQIVTFLQRNDTRKALHVGNLTLSNPLGTDTVYANLIDDLLRSVKDRLPALFAKYPFLIYSGQLDIIAAATSVETYLNSINYANYTTAARNPYFDGGRLIGWIKQAGNINRMTVRDAGHIVPYDQPKVVYDIVRKFVQKLPIGN